MTHKDDKIIKNAYKVYTERLKEEGFVADATTINEFSKTLVDLYSLNKGEYGPVININVPVDSALPGLLITIKGRLQIDSSIESPHVLMVQLRDINGIELDNDAHIHIRKLRNSGAMTDLVDDYIKYSNIRNGYTFDRGIELYHNNKLQISVDNPNINIASDMIVISLQADMWTRVSRSIGFRRLN